MNRNNNPFFSIIIATFNCEKFIEKCLESIISQNNTNYEIIIMDGLSKDNTIDIIKKYADKIAYFKSEKDDGIYDAWNKSIEQSKGEWIIFLGADDYLYNENSLSNAYSELSKISNKNTLIAYSKVKVIDDKSNLSWITNKAWSSHKKNFFNLNNLHHQGVFHRKDLFIKHGKFDSSFKIAGDYEFLLREIKNSDPIFIDNIFSCSNLGGFSTNLIYAKKALLECRKARNIHIQNYSINFYWFFAYFKLQIKLIIIKLFSVNILEKVEKLFRKKIKKRKKLE